MFEVGNRLYVDKPVHMDTGEVAFRAYTMYEVYQVEDDMSKAPEPVVLNELGMLCALEDIQEYFRYVH